MTAAPVIVQPDLEAWLHAQLVDVPGATSFAFSSSTTSPPWIVAHSVQVDCRSKRKTAARDAAERARQIVYALPDVDWPEGVVCYVQATEGPFWQPDDDGLPRYCARYEIRVHPRRDSDAIQAAPATHPRRRPVASPRR